MFRRRSPHRRSTLVQGIRRSASKKLNRTFGRMLRHEPLEDRRVLTLLGVAPLEFPTTDYDFGVTSYDSGTNTFAVSAFPIEADLFAPMPGDTVANDSLFLSGTFDFAFTVDESGNLTGGIAGDDLILTGDVLTPPGADPPFYVSTDGPLLTAEIVAFGHQDSGGSTDAFDFEFVITGGQFAGLFSNTRLGVTLTSDGSSFTGDFNVSFSGGATGQLGGLADAVENPALDLEKLVNGFDADTPASAPEINPGGTVVFTYEVTNTGDVAFDLADVAIVDDNGTAGTGDDLTTADGDIVLLLASDVGGDGILSPGETWQYQHVTTAQTLSPGEVYANSATATAPGASDTDLGHYANPEIPFPDDAPTITFALGEIDYDATTNIWTMDAKPLDLHPGFFFDGDFDIGAVIDENGNLVSGVAGSDFVLAGEVDLNGDFIPDLNGVILTAEIIGFASTNSGGTTDYYTLRFAVTGGLLAGVYSGQDLVVNITSENSNFTGDFTANFSGDGQGAISPVESAAALMASVGNYFFIDVNGNGTQDLADLGVNGVTVNLLDDDGNVIASTETANDADGNAGFYLFYNLQAGSYAVQFEVPEGVQFTTKDSGDDARDSDANASGVTDLFALEAGEHRRDIDAGILPLVTVEETVYVISDHRVKNQNSKAGKIDSIDIQYSESADELLVSIDFEEHGNRLADGFTFVITPGQWPGGTEDKYAIFYFDADIYNRNGGPVLTVYGYNGRYDATSFRDSDGRLRGFNDADRVATSMDNSSGWVLDLDVDTYRESGRWHRTMTFRIVASAVNDHVPLQSVVWSGAQFEDRASYSIDTFDGLYAKYNSEGYIRKWSWSKMGGVDKFRVHAEESTILIEVALEDLLDDFGWVTSAYVEGASDGDPPTTLGDNESDLDWAGSIDAALEDVFA